MAKRPNTRQARTPEVNPLTGTDSIWTEPPTDPEATPGGWVDNPLNPRGIPSNLTDGAPDSQATDAQKTQNAVPKRAPIMTNVYPDPFYERVSAGQNRKPPQEIIP